ncbi:MAG: hypothetical protein IJM79_05710 [Erysipelotrichaceae bacterium]|nr:hypothetical protein [Erysipelotrichaceae bacterium]
MTETEKMIDEAIAASDEFVRKTANENIIFTFNCRFSLDRVSYDDFEGFADHSYQLNAELFRDTVRVSYRSGQHNETIPSIQYEGIVSRDFMKKLDDILKASDVLKYNGMHRITAGLPEGYGCALEVRYAYGPGISLSNNSFLYFTVDFMQQLIRLFHEASGAAAEEESGRLNGVSYSQYENGINTLQVYILLNRDDTVRLEYYDRKNFLTRISSVPAAILSELQQLYEENDMEYVSGSCAEPESLKIVLDMRFGRKCRSLSTDNQMTNLQITAMESIRDIIERYLFASLR